MPLGCWLPLVPATEQQPPTPPPPPPPPPTQQQQPTTTIPFPYKKAAQQQQHTHDHHPSPNSFLKPMVLESHARRTKQSIKRSTKPRPLPLTENSSIISTFSNPPSASSCFEIRPLQVCDIEKVRELHCASLPVTYPSSFFYNLLAGNPNEQISLVATLPSTGLQGYLDVLNSLGQPPSQPALANHHCHLGHHHHHHHHHHHVTSPLSGRKPISLDVVGTITARLAPDPTPSGTAVRILTLCVSPDYRRFGVGRLLLESMLKQIKARFSRRTSLHPSHQSARKIFVNLHVQATNTVAHAFYQSAGFFRVAFKPGYYSNDDLKPLDPALKLASALPSTPKPFSQLLLPPSDLPASQDPPHSKPSDIDAWFLELALDYV